MLRRYLGSAWDEAPIGGVIVVALAVAVALFNLQGIISVSWWWVLALALAVPAFGLMVLLVAFIVTWIEGK